MQTWGCGHPENVRSDGEESKDGPVTCMPRRGAPEKRTRSSQRQDGGQESLGPAERRLPPRAPSAKSPAAVQPRGVGRNNRLSW